MFEYFSLFFSACLKKFSFIFSKTKNFNTWDIIRLSVRIFQTLMFSLFSSFLYACYEI